MDIKIKKAKLTKDGRIEATYIDADGNEITLRGKNYVHLDLRNALSRLTPYFTELTEQKEADSIDWENPGSEANNELLKQISVSSVSIGGSKETPFVTLTGRRILLTRKVLNLNSPGVEFADESLEHGDKLEIAVNDFLYEVEQYILHGKYDTQGTFDFDFGEEENDGDAADPFGEVDTTTDIAIPA